MESRHGFLLQKCLDGTRRSSPAQAGRSEPALATTSQRPPTAPKVPAAITESRSHCHHLTSAARHDDCVPLAGVPELPLGLGGRHQSPDQPGALRLLRLSVHVILF